MPIQAQELGFLHNPSQKGTNHSKIIVSQHKYPKNMPRERIGDVPLTFSTGVRLDERDRQQLEQLAIEKQMPRNALIREAIREFLSNEARQLQVEAEKRKTAV